MQLSENTRRLTKNKKLFTWYWKIYTRVCMPIVIFPYKNVCSGVGTSMGSSTLPSHYNGTQTLQHHCRRIYFNMECKQYCLCQRVYLFLLSSYHAIDTVYVWVRECKCIGISHVTYQIFLVRSWIRKQHFSVAKSGCRYSDLAMMKSPLKFLHKSIHFCMEKRQSAYRHAYIFSNTN